LNTIIGGTLINGCPPCGIGKALPGGFLYKGNDMDKNYGRESVDVPQMELPRYKSHKEVWALKIAVIINNPEDGTAMITPAKSPYADFKVIKYYMEKHCPLPGGYYVQYKDGYKSYSPAEAFEEGYSLV